MSRLVLVIISLSIAALILVGMLAGPSPSVPTLATTPTWAFYAPLIAKPFPPTATATTPPATATPPAVTATPTSLPPTFNGCQDDPLAGAAPNYPVRIVSIDKVAEVVTLQNVSTGPISLDGWHMCSIKGNQEHPISGTLAPGQARSFGHTGEPIWNNTERDDGALYNAAGSLISYYVDQ